jgi:uncharacterized protein YggE
MKNVHDVAIYSVMGLVFLLAFRASVGDKQEIQIVERGTPGTSPEQSLVTVTGTAEMLVPPDEISVMVSYREYWRNGEVHHKVAIDTIEEKIIKAVADAGLPRQSISIDSQASWKHNWNYWNYWYGSSDLLMQRDLTIALHTTSQLQQIIENLKSESLRKEGIVSITLSGSTSSKIQEYRKRVKEEAMQAAQAKASYLLESVDQTRGRLVRVTELKDPQTATTTSSYGYPYYDWGGWGYSSQTQTNMGVSNVSVAVPYDPGSSREAGSSDLSMKPIRLQYAIEASFEIERPG